MSESIVRLSCVAENCGTFPMDRALYDKLKRSGETWCCPEGHQQHFTETTEDALREELAELQRVVEEKERRISKLKQLTDSRNDSGRHWYDRAREKAERVNLLERMLLERAEGIVQVAPEGYKWSCSCGSRAQKVYDTPEEAQERYRAHARRTDCGTEELPLLEAE